MRIIGCGNRARGDDAAGVLVAERLLELGVEADIHTGEALALVEAWEGAEEVIVVDAVVSGAPAGTIHDWDSRDCRQSLPVASSPASTHGLGVAEAIELSRSLGRLPQSLRVYGIEGRRFDLGASLSPELRAVLEEVVQRILAQVSRGRAAQQT